MKEWKSLGINEGGWLKKGIDCIKSVLRFAACFVTNDYSSYSSVSSMLTDLSRPSLQSRHRICNLGMFYKIHRGQLNISLPYDPTSLPEYGCTRANLDFKVRLRSSSADAYKHSFCVRSIPHYWQILLDRHLIQYASEKCPLFLHINLITTFIFILCKS